MNLEDIFKKLNIKFDEISHKAVFTSEEAEFIKSKIDGMGVKNLFLKEKDKYYLYLILDTSKANLKELSKFLGIGKLHFGSIDELKEVLNLTPGSVTPLAIIYDKNNLVTILIDKALVSKKLLFHPNINTKTISIKYEDLLKFLKYFNHEYKIVELK